MGSVLVNTVSILLSTYNGEKYLDEQIQSLQKQNECKICILVRDDGSSDSTCGMLDEYARKGILKWYTGGNIRSAKSFCDLLLKCEESDYYAFCDQDDIWDDDKLIVAINTLKMDRAPALYYSNTRLIDSFGIDLNKNGYKHMIINNLETLVCSGGPIGCTMVFNNKLYKIIKEHQIPETLIMHDYYTVIIGAMFGNIYYDSIPHISYRQHSNNVMGLPLNRIDALRRRINYCFKKPLISISEQTQSILSIYKSEIPKNKYVFMKLVSKYRNSLIKRCQLAFSTKIKYTTLNSYILIRLTILLGNR